jgi:hypothetical protein
MTGAVGRIASSGLKNAGISVIAMNVKAVVRVQTLRYRSSLRYRGLCEWRQGPLDS